MAYSDEVPLVITNKAGAVLKITRSSDADGCWNFSFTTAGGDLLGVGILSDIVSVMKAIAGHCGGKVIN